eukprot:5172234-Prymnesium_polylepis.1
MPIDASLNLRHLAEAFAMDAEKNLDQAAHVDCGDVSFLRVTPQWKPVRSAAQYRHLVALGVPFWRRFETVEVGGEVVHRGIDWLRPERRAKADPQGRREHTPAKAREVMTRVDEGKLLDLLLHGECHATHDKNACVRGCQRRQEV